MRNVSTDPTKEISFEFSAPDKERGVFIQAFGNNELDAALLLLPKVEFVDYKDERMIRTTDAIRQDLDDDGLLKRFRSDVEEGAFLACSFWLSECLARQGRVETPRRSSTAPSPPATISASSPKSTTRKPAKLWATSPRD